jgi:thioredoxin-related protein
MKLLKTFSFLVFPFLGLNAGITASEVRIDGADVGQWTMDFEAAKELAAGKGLPMMLNFTGSDWCIWCKRMDAQVFSKDAWKEYAADKIILVTLDYPRDKSIVPEKYRARNNGLKGQFGIQGYPTYIILESDGETKIGQLGAGQDKTAESFIKEFQNAMKTSAAYVEELAEKDPEKAAALKAAIAESKAAHKALNDWLSTRPQRTPENEKLFDDFIKRIEEADQVLAEF